MKQTLEYLNLFRVKISVYLSLIWKQVAGLELIADIWEKSND